MVCSSPARRLDSRSSIASRIPISRRSRPSAVSVCCLGTVGLATVVLRNALERRHELALLRACGYERRDFPGDGTGRERGASGGGLAAGALCAMVAVVPAVAERGGRLPLTLGGALIVVAVLVGGLLSSVLATRAALRGPLLETLRSE
jgi:hypothetical protein